MRRLYVGGLSHLITEKDLKDRFGKFGKVEDVELRTRKDEDGVPYKTFGYINIDISDVDLKKCLTVLNKSKWKGGTLQIEMAKESFLHRLAEERQAATEQCLKPPKAEDKRQKLLDSLSKAGVENFTMKAAVPGTEIAGHKDWIVSKFGRVLPVLQLRCQKGNKARTLKYDPSKYCHNIRKLDRDATVEPTPVTQLTWEVQGGDDDISKKRRGEFPPYQPPRPKKSRTNVVNSCNTAAKTKPSQIVEAVNPTEAHRFKNGFLQSTNQRATHRRGAYLNDGDVDSDEEIRRLVEAQQISHSALQQVSEDDNLEVVGFDYLKSGKKGRSEDKNEDDYDSADTDELFASRKPPPPPPQKKSAPPIPEQLTENNTDRRKKRLKRKGKAGGQEEDEEDLLDADEDLTCWKSSTTVQRRDASKQNCQTKGGISEKQSNEMADLPLSESDFSDDEDEDEEELDSDDSCSDSDYEGMFSNVTHLEISLADLQRLAEENQETSDTTAPSILSTGLEQKTNLPSGPTEQPAPKKGTLPEDILAAILEDNSSEDEQGRKKGKRKGVITSLPAFQGTRALNQGLDEFMKAQKEQDERRDVKKQKLDSAAQLNPRATTSGTTNQQKHTETKKTPESRHKDMEEQKRKGDVVKDMPATKGLKGTPSEAETVSSSSNSSSDDDGEHGDEKEGGKSLQAAVTAKASLLSSSSSFEEDEEKSTQDPVKAAPSTASDSDSFSSDEDEKEEHSLPRVSLKAEDEEEQQRKANMRRLAAVQQRQKEAEEHKKLIQGALANPDAQKAGAGKHIVFGSDDEDDEEEVETTSEISTSKKPLFQEGQSDDDSTSDEAPSNQNNRNIEKERLKPSGPQLFGGSDAEDDGDEKEDGGRFDIRPQFEGRAGQKLMELQSRFGTDERFRMDSRFLEDDEKKDEESEGKDSMTQDDEALEQERKKNLDILQSVLGSSQQTSSKTSSKAKTFRDVSSLHYDPSKEEHAAFETTADESKESKSARKKKREEAQKLPEVSKEIYFDVSGDLTTMFGLTKSDVPGQEENTTWDQEKEEEAGGQDEEPTLLSSAPTADLNADKEESAGFKFSFFGDDTETENKLTAEYKVESIQTPKASWQQDPRFQDSSSDEDEDEQEEEEEPTSTATKMREEEKETPSKVNLFFFHPEDIRLTEGPRLFCRSTQLENQREQWEERRNELRQEYRKKHKNARRKLKSSQQR
ncbi:nucleolar protein 8 [Betta splendens]|uniref:Nucleolar protein 8 n=1 Tax=Betta splendens TaxID=158456 RepID=A0A6P7MHZ8_BETSP|nr:nucleolar protein 8 [Betta splendens]